jgi:hypothetical protein
MEMNMSENKATIEKRKLRALDPLLYDSCEDQLHKQSSFVEHFYQLVTQEECPVKIMIDNYPSAATMYPDKGIKLF